MLVEVTPRESGLHNLTYAHYLISRNITMPSDTDIPNMVDLKALKEDRDYVLTYVSILRDLTLHEDCDVLNEAKTRLAKVLKHTVPYGRQFEGLGVVDTYKLIESPRNLTPDNIRLAHVMGWCVAMQAASYIIEDDIIDKEETRKGLPCWHTLDNIGLTAINDSFVIENATFHILKKYFSKHQCYVQILELFHKTNYKISLGQTIDTASTMDGKPRFEAFTRKRYKFICEYKCTSYCYEFPLKLATYLADLHNPELSEQLYRIVLKIGMLLTAHNDLEDAFGNAEIVGKKSTDITNGRCTWLAVEALERGTPQQKQHFMEHYGVHSDESEKTVKDLYHELNLLQVYLEFEQNLLASIYEDIEHVSDRLPKIIFDNLLSDVTQYRRGYCYQ